jgi:3-oxoadipate enol-lactonase
MPSVTTPKRLDVPGGQLAYDDAGNGRSIVLLHEGITDRRMWDREFANLAGSYRVVRYDHRGFGGSTPATQSFSFVDDLGTVIRELRLDRPVIVGPSMSGAIALDFALAHPESTAGLFLMAPGVSGMQLEYDPEGREAFEYDERESNAIATAWKAGHRDEAEELLRKLWASSLQGTGLELFRRMVRENAPEVFEDRSARLAHLDGAPAARRLHEVAVPTHVIVGDRDNPSSPRFAMYIARSVPGAQLTVVPGADHVLNLSAPAEFDAALGEFLRRVREAPAETSRAHR